MHKCLSAVLVLLLLLTGGTSCLLAQAKPADVQSFTLPNGMKFGAGRSFHPQRQYVPVLESGPRNEHPGITGLSHFFEHMMFNGAKKYGPKMFDQVMEAGGRKQQRLHHRRRNRLHQLVPGTALETIFDLESDRIRDLNF